MTRRLAIRAAAVTAAMAVVALAVVLALTLAHSLDSAEAGASKAGDSQTSGAPRQRKRRSAASGAIDAAPRRRAGTAARPEQAAARPHGDS